MGLQDRGVGANVGKRLDQVDRVVKLAVVRMVDGMEIRGTIYVPPDLRTLDMLNRQTENFLAITDATISLAGRTEHSPFMTVNKAHIVSLRDVG